MQQVSDVDVAAGLTQDMVAGCVGVRVGRLHRLVSREFERHLRPIGLSLQQLEVLSTLTVCAGPVKPTVVADMLALERSTMSRNLTILTDRGLVASADTSSTGRSLTVVITPKGTTMLARAADAWQAAQTALVARLGREAPTTLDGWLAELTSGAGS